MLVVQKNHNKLFTIIGLEYCIVELQNLYEFNDFLEFFIFIFQFAKISWHFDYNYAKFLAILEIEELTI